MTGRENDGATGLYYYRSRFYSPQMGRFVSEDPLGIGAGANVYAYVNGNPVLYRDALGECPWCIAGGLVGLVQGYANGVAAGDEGYTLLLDASIGMLTGAIVPGIEGFGLVPIAMRLGTNVGFEYARQRLKGVQTGCYAPDRASLVATGLSSLAGDFVGKLGAVNDVLAFGESSHWLSSESEDILSAGGLAAGSVVQSLFDVELEFLHHGTVSY